MTITAVGSPARTELARSQSKLDADTASRDAAARAVQADTKTVAKAQESARRELQAGSAQGSLVDVTV